MAEGKLEIELNVNTGAWRPLRPVWTMIVVVGAFWFDEAMLGGVVPNWMIAIIFLLILYSAANKMFVPSYSDEDEAIAAVRRAFAKARS